jgi:hypothetical protein
MFVDARVARTLGDAGSSEAEVMGLIISPLAGHCEDHVETLQDLVAVRVASLAPGLANTGRPSLRSLWCHGGLMCDQRSRAGTNKSNSSEMSAGSEAA